MNQIKLEDLSANERKVYDALIGRTERKYAIPGKLLAITLSVSYNSVRGAIRSLRTKHGVAIGSSASPLKGQEIIGKGYWIITKPEEWAEFESLMRAEGVGTLHTLSKMKGAAIESVFRQGVLDLKASGGHKANVERVPLEVRAISIAKAYGQTLAEYRRLGVTEGAEKKRALDRLFEDFKHLSIEIARGA